MRPMLCTFLLFGFLTGCATIEVYQVGRQTIMEEEAQGEWPEFEKEFAKKTLRKQAEFFPKEPQSKRKDRVFSVLSGEHINKP